LQQKTQKNKTEKEVYAASPLQEGADSFTSLRKVLKWLF